MTKKIILMSLAAFAFAGSAFAEEAKGGKLPYGVAGCGLGSVIFEPSAGFLQVSAATTNATFYNQTFGITFGTLNCKGMSDKLKLEGQKSLERQIYVYHNLNTIKVEISRGEGEKLATLAQMMGCSGGSVRAFSAKAKDNYPKIAEVAGNEIHQTEGIYYELSAMVASDSSLSQSCKSIF